MGGYIWEDDAQAMLGTFSDGWMTKGRKEGQDDVAEWPWIRNGGEMGENAALVTSVAGKNRERDGGWSL